MCTFLPIPSVFYAVPPVLHAGGKTCACRAVAVGYILVASVVSTTIVIAITSAYIAEPAAEEAPAAAAAVVLAPVEYEKQTEEHTAEVSHVGNVVASMAQSAKQFDYSVTHNEPFCLDGHRDRNDEKTFVGERHAKAEQYAIDGS